jgi:hypothetical protein
MVKRSTEKSAKASGDALARFGFVQFVLVFLPGLNRVRSRPAGRFCGNAHRGFERTFRSNVAYWPKADITTVLNDVCF